MHLRVQEQGLQPVLQSNDLDYFGYLGERNTKAS